jgi:hypothetical protein
MTREKRINRNLNFLTKQSSIYKLNAYYKSPFSSKLDVCFCCPQNWWKATKQPSSTIAQPIHVIMQRQNVNLRFRVSIIIAVIIHNTSRTLGLSIQWRKSNENINEDMMSIEGQYKYISSSEKQSNKVEQNSQHPRMIRVTKKCRIHSSILKKKPKHANLSS